MPNKIGYAACRLFTDQRRTCAVICCAVLSFILFSLSACSDSASDNKNSWAWTVPAHPFMAANGRSNVHNDAYMTDTYSIAGPADDNLNLTFTNMNRICITIAFNHRGSIETLCTGADSRRAVYLMDPSTLGIMDSYELPAGTDLGAAGAGYFYLDNLDRMVVPTTNKHVYRFDVAGDPPLFRLETDFDLTALPDPLHIVSILPDWNGLLWFVTQEGVVGILNEGAPPKTFSLTHMDGSVTVSEGIHNSFAVDETGGVYIVSDYAIYRFDADADGNPTVTWREEYDRGTRQKPGQFVQGSGTTPTLIGRDYLTITDNAEPRMNVLVYKRRKEVTGSRLLCQVPVFRDGASATENSLIAFGNSIIVENNYGYTKAVDFIGKMSEPGVTRIDFFPDGHYDIVWNSSEVAPSVVSKYSSVNGIVYTYTKDTDGWYFTGLSGDTGKRVFRKKVGGDELRFNNHYSGIAIGPDGSAYVGTVGGIVRLGP